MWSLKSYWNDLFPVFSKGKYVEIQFSRGGEPIGGRISNFLLEKVCDGLLEVNIGRYCLTALLFSPVSGTDKQRNIKRGTKREIWNYNN